MINERVLELGLTVMLGGLFGWTLGKLPDRWVYAAAAVTILLTLVFAMGR